MPFGYEGEQVRLAPLEVEKHLEQAYRWMNDPELTDNLLVGDRPMSLSAERSWFEEVEKDERGVVFAIETLEGEYLGNTGLHRINHRHGFATGGTFIGNKEHRGKGYGTEALWLRSVYAFDVLGLRFVRSEFFGGNEASWKMQQKVGFEIIGTLPKMWWINGRYRDEVMTLQTRQRFEEIRAQGGPFRRT